MSDHRHNKGRCSTYISFVKAMFSIFLASLVLVSTSGVGVTKHFCGNRVASISLLGDGGCSCGAMDDADGCCHTERDFFQLDDDFSVAPVQSLSLASASIISVLVYHLSFDFNDCDHYLAFQYYKPPIPDKDIPVLIQSFLI